MMEQFLIYLLEVNILLIVLFAVFWWIARKETFHQLNRIILLLILLGVFCIPLISFPGVSVSLPSYLDFSSAGEQTTAITAEENTGMSKLDISELSGNMIIENTFSEAVSWLFRVDTILVGVYLIITSFFLLKFFLQFLSLYRLVQSGKHYWDEGLIQVHVEEDISPFSFFHWVFFNPDHLKEGDRVLIIEHERVHAEQYHNIDILLGGLCTVILWFNPFAWKLRRIISQNLEYIADEQMLRKGVNRKRYQYSLLSLNAPLVRLSVANHFNYSLIKNRIHMMNIKKSPDHRQIRYLLFFPLLICLLLASNITYAQSKAKEKPKKEVKEKADAKPKKDKVTKVKPKAKVGKADVIEVKPELDEKSDALEVMEVAPSAEVEDQVSGVVVEGVAVKESLVGTVSIASETDPETVVVGQLATTQSVGTGVVVSGSSTSVVVGKLASTDAVESVAIQNAQFAESVGAGTPEFNIPVEEDENVFLVIRSDFNQQMLDEIEDILRKHGIYTRFSDIQFNAGGQLTSIYVGVKVGDQYQGEMRGYNGGKPLEEPIVMYVMKEGTDEFGISTGIPGNLSANTRSSLSRLTGLLITQGEDNFIKGIWRSKSSQKGAY